MKKMPLAGLLIFALIVATAVPVYAGEIHDAAMQGDITRVRKLLEQGVNVNARNDEQKTPLHEAAYYGKTEVTRFLLERGADVNAKDDYQESPLLRSIWSRMAEVSRLLVEKGADVNARDRQQNTPLHWAVCGYKIDFVRLLIEKGADVNAKDGWQYTPLHRAARCGKTEVARFLIERGADANAKDYDGDTPAMIADKMNHPQTASAIRRQGGGSAKQDFETRLRKVAKQGFVLPDDLMVIVKLAGSLVPPPTTPQQARDEMTKGIASSKLAKHTEDFRQAGEHFKKASVLAPWLSESYFNLSIVQEKQYKWDEAISSLEKYLIAAPDARDANAVKQKLAELDIQKRRWEDFEKEVSTGVAIYNKGSKEYNEAILHWKKAIELYPQHPQIDQVYYNIGEAYMNQSNLDDAFKYMQKSMEVNPDANNAARYTNMGVVLDRRGDGAKACIYYKKGCNYGSKIGCDNHRDMNCQ